VGRVDNKRSEVDFEGTIQEMRSGIQITDDIPGAGPLVERRRTYQVRVRLRLNKGDAIRWKAPWGLTKRARLEDDGATLITDVRIDRVNLINGLFYGIEGMRVGGTRKLRISPHMAYRERGIPGVIPENAVLLAEISILEECA